MLKRAFVSRETDFWKKLYMCIIRIHLEHQVQVWNPRLIGHTERLERVQRRASKTLTTLNKLGYDQRLAQLA